MILQIKYGWEPDAEAADKAAQMDEKTAQELRLFDRCEQWLIFHEQVDARAAAARLSHGASPEPDRLLMVADSRNITPTDRYDDFAWTSDRGYHYLDLALIRVFRLQASLPDAEPAPALLQLEEHLVATFADHRQSSDCDKRDAWHAIESHLAELADRIARAYRCEIAWFDDPGPS